MDKRNLLFAREVEMPIFYAGQQIGLRRVDFFVQDLILVKLQAVAQLEKLHLAQALNYLEAFSIGTGLLISFGSPAWNSAA